MKYSIENSAKLVNWKHYSLYVNGLYTSNTRKCENKHLQSLIKAHVVEDVTTSWMPLWYDWNIKSLVALLNRLI